MPDESAPPDSEAARALETALNAVGVAPVGPHLAETPARVAALWRDLFSAHGAPIALPADSTFASPDPGAGLVLAADLPFHAMCAHHLLPFFGRVHLAFLPGARLVGFGALARLVDTRGAAPDPAGGLRGVARQRARGGARATRRGRARHRAPPVHGDAGREAAFAHGDDRVARRVPRRRRASRRVPGPRGPAASRRGRRGRGVSMPPRVERTESRLTIGERPDGSVITLPVIRFTGGPGRELFIGVTIHGDEITGQASLWRVAAWLEQSELHGAVTARPGHEPRGLQLQRARHPGHDCRPQPPYPAAPTATRTSASPPR